MSESGIKENADRKQSVCTRRLWIIITGCVAILFMAAIVVRSYITEKYAGEKSVRVNVSPATDKTALEGMLRDRLGAFGGKVYFLWNMMADSVHAGSYEITPSTSAFSAARMIAKGRQTPVMLTFNNLRTIEQLAQRVSHIMACDSASFIAAVDSVVTSRGLSRAQAAACFLPDSYEFYYTASPGRIVDKLIEVRDHFWESRRAKAASISLTPEQVCTVASIVEEESAKTDERPRIARLYLNRLAKGMHLQADPTVKFALGDFSLRRITGKHLAVESPYNTYKYAGLPPGPIRIVDSHTIDAVLDAPEHNYLYMCAKEDFSGYHNFSTDYTGHQRNAARYRAALDRRGIK